jgi:hypothetical protein
LLKEAVPRISRVALLMRPESSSHTLLLKEIEAAARVLNVQLQVVRARTPAELDTAFSVMARARADALIVLADPIFLFTDNGSPTSRQRTGSRRCTDWRSMRRQADYILVELRRSGPPCGHACG